MTRTWSPTFRSESEIFFVTVTLVELDVLTVTVLPSFALTVTVDPLTSLTVPAVNPPPGGESGLQIAARATAFVEEVKRAHPSGNIAAVSHKGTIRVLVCMLLGIELAKFRAQLGMPASAVTIFEFRKDGPFLLAYGDTAHVPPHLRHDLGA